MNLDFEGSRDPSRASFLCAPCFDLDQCADCDDVVGIMGRAFVTEDAVFSSSLN
jgi:hypothetical protein